jgi:hypothetical protein
VGRAGREGEEEGMGRRGGKCGPAVWAANWVWAGFSFLFLGFPFLSYLKHHSFYLNSNSNLNSNLALKQKEQCTSMNATTNF